MFKVLTSRLQKRNDLVFRVFERAATGAMISFKNMESHSSKEMDPSPFSSIFAKRASLSAEVWKGAGSPSLFCALVATLIMVANSELETCPSLSASAAWKHFQLNQYTFL